jgi:hypothetical protein
MRSGIRIAGLIGVAERQLRDAQSDRDGANNLACREIAEKLVGLALDRLIRLRESYANVTDSRDSA